VPLWGLDWAAGAMAFAGLAAAPFVLMSARKRSVARGTYSVVSWCVHAAGLVRGFLARRAPAHEPIPSLVLRDTGRPAPSSERASPDTAAPAPRTQR